MRGTNSIDMAVMYDKSLKAGARNNGLYGPFEANGNGAWERMMKAAGMPVPEDIQSGEVTDKTGKKLTVPGLDKVKGRPKPASALRTADQTGTVLDLANDIKKDETALDKTGTKPNARPKLFGHGVATTHAPSTAPQPAT